MASNQTTMQAKAQVAVEPAKVAILAVRETEITGEHIKQHSKCQELVDQFKSN